MVRRATMAAVVGLAVAATMPAGAQAQGRGQGRGQGKAPDAAPGVEASVTLGFSAGERETILKYYTSHQYAARRLPPGIVKNLARGKPLPPGIAKQAIPTELVALLPRRAGLEVTIFGDRIVLLEAKGLVVDVLADVFR